MDSAFLLNFGLLAIGAFAVFVIGSRARLQAGSFLYSLILGLVFGIICAVVVDYPLVMESGATFDTRAGPALLSGFFGGPWAALVTALIGGGQRYIEGGPMAFGGTLSVILYAVTGAVMGRFLPRAGRETGVTDLLAVALVGSVMVLPAFFIDRGFAFGLGILEKSWPYFLTGIVGSTLVLGLMFLEMRRRLTLDEDLKRTFETLSLATRSAKIGVWRRTLASGRLEWDDRMYDIYGLRPEDFSGRYEEWRRFVLPEDWPGVEAAFDAAQATDKPFERAFRIRRPDGSVRTIRAHAVFRGGDGAGPVEVIGLNYDITDEALRQAELERLTRELEENLSSVSAANNAKSEFLARMSHEFRTPLNAIIGFAQLIELKAKRSPPLPPEGELARKYVQDIQRAGEHLLGLVNSVLDIARIEEGQMQIQLEPLSPREMVSRALRAVQPLSRQAGIRLRGRAPRTLPPVLADPGAVHQCLLNLLSNAIKFSKPGRRVVLTVECLGDTRLAFTVQDQGTGIPADALPTLGTPFHQVGDVYRGEVSGAGLGLAITKGLVLEMNGHLEIKSDFGSGTTVTMILPVVPVADGEAGVSDGDRAPPDPGATA